MVKNRAGFWLVVSLSCVLVGGCGAKKELEELRTRADRLQNQLNEFNKTWKESNAAIVAAAEGVDPLALKMVLSENRELSTMLRKLQDAAKVQPAAYLQVKAGTIYLEPAAFNGSFKVDAALEGRDVTYLDGVRLSPENAVLIDSVNDLDLDYTDWLRAFCVRHYNNSNLEQCAGNLAGVVDQYMFEVRGRFDRLLTRSRQARTNVERIDISTQAGGIGKRTVLLTITPLAPPQSGTWFAKFHVVQVRGGNREVLRTIERSASTHTFVAGQPLAPAAIRLELTN